MILFIIISTACGFSISTVNNTKWRLYLKKGAEEFASLVRYWLDEAHISVLAIRYEDMKADLAAQLIKMLDFLQVSYSPSDIDCVTSSKFEMFHRKKSVSADFQPYTPADKQFVWDKLMSVKPILDKYNISYEPTNDTSIR